MALRRERRGTMCRKHPPLFGACRRACALARATRVPGETTLSAQAIAWTNLSNAIQTNIVSGAWGGANTSALFHFSSTCYYFGESLSDELGAQAPAIGLIHTACKLRAQLRAQLCQGSTVPGRERLGARCGIPGTLAHMPCRAHPPPSPLRPGKIEPSPCGTVSACTGPVCASLARRRASYSGNRKRNHL